MIRDAENSLGEAAREATQLGAPHVSTRFLTGVPWDQIVKTLGDDARYDLVVMGTQGRTGLARVLLGSVTEKVIRHAPCSVLAVRGHDGTAPFSRVLCPIDVSDGSRDAITIARAVASPTAEITLLHVVDVPASYAGEASMHDYLATIDRLATAMLDDRAKPIRATPGLVVSTRVESGSPVARTLAVLDEKPMFDLVVVGSHGRTGIRRILLGSVAERIVRHASCPVLVARSRASE